MNELIPTKIHRPKPYLLAMEWADGLTATVSMQRFREECPCAVCKGENIMGTTYSFGMPMFTPGMYELTALNPTGNYGIRAEWKDGHNTGIYTWEILRTIALKHNLTPEQLQQFAELEQQQASSIN